MYRQKKLEEVDEDGAEKDPKIPEKSPSVEKEEASSSTPISKNPEINPLKRHASKSPEVSSTLSPPKMSQMSKSMTMLSQIFPGKPQKVLEIKLREAKGDVVKALESCAKHFDQVESFKNQSSISQNNLSAVAPPLPISSTVAATENNNESAKIFPPFSTAALMALANNSTQKSAFTPANPHFYRPGFEPTAGNFVPKEFFPFPPPIFPPSFFVGFSPPTYHNTLSTPFNLTENSVPHHRPCVDPHCGQCAPKVDSTDESAKEDCE